MTKAAERPCRASYHWISADGPLSRADKVQWMLANLTFPLLPQPPLAFDTFQPTPAALEPNLHVADTPSRILCNAFWDSLPGAIVRRALGDRVDILDVGCGTGGYLPRFERAFGPLDGYLGVDASRYPSWPELTRPGVAFREAYAERLGGAELDGRTLVLSQSAVEHFPEDQLFFRLAAQHAVRQGRPVLHVHLLPPDQMWRYWGFHGFRGYNGRNLSRICSELRGASFVQLCTLGGRRVNALHLSHVHDTASSLLLRRPKRDLRESDAEGYLRALREACRDGRDRPRKLSDASFLALVVGFHLPADLGRRLVEAANESPGATSPR